MPKQPIYLDYNASTPVDPAVAESMLPYLAGHFGNPSSPHAFGVAAKRAVEHARVAVAACIGARPEEIVFTSGGSESNNMVIKGIATRSRSRGRHIVTSAVEHPAVLEPCRRLEGDGYRLTVLPVDALGRVDPSDVERALTPETILVSVMHANNEVGTIQPIAEIAALTRDRGIPFHTDAAQTVGKIRVDVAELGVDFLTIAGHKLYGPQGVGALYIRSGHDLPPLIDGAGHESGRRAGTENVLEIVGLGRACELAVERLDDTGSRIRALRDRLWERLSSGIESIRRNGDPDACLPNTLSVSLRGVEASTLLAEIGDRVAASAGAACHADGVDVSSVLEAMAVPLDWAMGTVRFSLGRSTTGEEIDEAAKVVVEAASRLGSGGASVDDDGPKTDDVRLTRFTHGMGCACKLRPQALEQVLRALPPSVDPSVLVDASTADDAAVYRLSDDLALVQSLDFFTPVADDPHDFGAISAANSLSDLYAMGAQPRFALSIVAFPPKRLPLEVLERILEGACTVAREAGIEIVGGHSVEDTEPKFGLAVTGTVHPDRMLTNAGARAGDVLVLTKPIGTGIVATAAKRGLAEERVVQGAIDVMRRLNRDAAEAMLEIGAHACTDVTGFGLLGHLREMAVASSLDAEVDAAAVPVLDGAEELAAADIVPGGTLDNLEHVAPHVDGLDGVPRPRRMLLCDAQTSGGLLVAVDPDLADALVSGLHRAGVESARVVGRFAATGTGRLRV